MRAQTFPVKVICVCEQNDEKGQQFAKAIRDTIELSSRFSIYDGNLADLPVNGVAIYVNSIQVEKDVDHNPMGSAMVIQAMRQSQLEKGYFHIVYAEMWMMPKQDQVSDTALSYMSSLREKLQHQTPSLHSQ